MREGITGGTNPDQEVVQDHTEEETASGEALLMARESIHVLLHAEKVPEDLRPTEKGTVLQGAEIEAPETSVDFSLPRDDQMRLTLSSWELRKNKLKSTSFTIGCLLISICLILLATSEKQAL